MLNEVVTISHSPSIECVNVSVFEDNLVEAAETFLLALNASDPAISLENPNVTTVTIISSDGN
jgi:hypothetical protein